MTGRAPLFTRSPANPILTPTDLPYPANAVFSPGAARVDGEAVLLVRVEDMRGVSHLHVARSADGVSGWSFDAEPLLRSEPDVAPEEVWGCEDPRLTWLATEGTWAIAYTAYSMRGPLVALATTRDFRHVERIGAWWDAGKIGLGPPPLETPEGWLIVYYGVHMTAGGPIYRAGLALLDLDDPTVVLRRSDEWIFGPEASYERSGDVPQVVFPSGLLLDPETGRLDMYYGAADSVVGLATAALDDVLAYLRTCPRP